MSRRTVGWLLVVLQFVLLLALILLPWRTPTLLTTVFGIALLVAAVILGVVAARGLGRALTPTPVPIAHAGLRTTGAYRYVRHPIYSAVLLGVLGYLIVLGSTSSWVCGAVILVFFWLKSRWEDKLLRAEYDEEWTAWARRTGALVPRLHPGRT